MLELIHVLNVGLKSVQDKDIENNLMGVHDQVEKIIFYNNVKYKTRKDSQHKKVTIKFGDLI
jgi:hypothetical protein